MNIAVKVTVVGFTTSMATDLIGSIWLALCLIILPLEVYSISVHCPTTLNRERFRLVLEAWQESREDLKQLSPAVVCSKERLLAPLFKQEWGLELGVALDELLVPLPGETGGSESLQLLLDRHAEDGYVLGACMRTRKLRAVLKEGAGDEAQLIACLHAHKVAKVLQKTHTSDANIKGVIAEILKEKKAVQVEWPTLQQSLEKQGWNISHDAMQHSRAAILNPAPWRLAPRLKGE